MIESIEAPIQGVVKSIEVSIGQEIKEGDVVAIMESMKMNIEITSHLSGRVTEINAKENESIDGEEPIIQIQL